MIVKDRVARGDNKYLMKQLNDGTGRIELTPSPDEIIEEGTVLNKSVLQPLFDGLDKIATVETVVNQGKQEIQSATNEAVERLSNAQPESNPKIYTTTELSDPQEGKIYNVKITENTSTINEKAVYKEGTSESVTLKAGKVATVYYQGGSFFYKANASGDALAEHVLAGKTFSNSDDTDITGTMVNHGAKTFKPSTTNIIIPKGFYNGEGYVEGDPDLVAGNIVQGKNIFGVQGNALKYEQIDKARIANAITSKGVATSTTASWGQIEQNIRSIKSLSAIPHFNLGHAQVVTINFTATYSGYSHIGYTWEKEIVFETNSFVFLEQMWMDEITKTFSNKIGIITPVIATNYGNTFYVNADDRAHYMYFVSKGGAVKAKVQTKSAGFASGQFKYKVIKV